MEAVVGMFATPQTAEHAADDVLATGVASDRLAVLSIATGGDGANRP